MRDATSTTRPLTDAQLTEAARYAASKDLGRRPERRHVQAGRITRAGRGRAPGAGGLRVFWPMTDDERGPA